MNQTAATNKHQYPFTDEDWNGLRFSLQHTVMAKTNLCSLAKNLGLKWPIRGKGEIPERYINFTLEELANLPEFFGKENRLPLLYSILLETKELDDPFVDIIEQLDNFPKGVVETPSLLEQLEFPPDFPVEFMNFSKRTRAICKDGSHDTVSQLITFMQQSPSAAIINDEFREFFSCVNNMDKSRLRKFLPIREGSKGIFLAEAIGHIGRRLRDSHASTLVHAYSIKTTHAEWTEEVILPKAQALSLIKEVKETAEKCFEMMPDEAQHLRCAIESGNNSIVRFFVPLNDPDMEGLAMAIAMAAFDVKPRLKGLLGSFLN